MYNIVIHNFKGYIPFVGNKQHWPSATQYIFETTVCLIPNSLYLLPYTYLAPSSVPFSSGYHQFVLYKSASFFVIVICYILQHIKLYRFIAYITYAIIIYIIGIFCEVKHWFTRLTNLFLFLSNLKLMTFLLKLVPLQSSCSTL